MTTPPPRKRRTPSKATPAKKAQPGKKAAVKKVAKKAQPAKKTPAKKAAPNRRTPAAKAPTTPSPPSEPILSPDGTQQWDGSAWVAVARVASPPSAPAMPPPPTGPTVLPPPATVPDSPSGRDLRAEARADKAATKAKRNWFLRHKVLSFVGVVIVIVIIASIAGSSGGGGKSTPASAPTSVQSPVTSSPSGSPSIAHSEDVKITKCGAGDLGGPSATIVVTNHSSKASNYIIEIQFQSADGKTQYGTGDAAVNSLQPGQSSAPQTADALTTTAAPAGFTCSLAQLTRYAS